MDRVKILLTDDELQMPSIDELINKCFEWLKLSKECEGGRKTRSAAKKADQVYDEIMSFKLPRIKLDSLLSTTTSDYSSAITKTMTDVSDDSDSNSSMSSRPILRSLRSRSKTPVVQSTTTSRTSPCTPQNQKLRAHWKQATNSGSSSSNGSGSNVLCAALNLQHPSVSVTKIRQLLRADSAQKKREEEKERHEKLMSERRIKEERARAQKKQILEERAMKAKEKRELRLNHAAEVRKAREEAKQMLKLQEEAKKAQLQATYVAENGKATEPSAPVQQQQPEPHHQNQQMNNNELKANSQNDATREDLSENKINKTHTIAHTKVNETFKKPSVVNNIDIIIQDETDDGNTDKSCSIATWAKAPHLRALLIEQFSKPYKERNELVMNLFRPLKSIKNIELSQIFGSGSAVDKRYLCRTSSAVWTPPRALKRRSSQVSTANNEG